MTIEARIAELKAGRNAVILVHNYSRGDVQDVGDFVGDSLGLSREAARTRARVILFCGVHFMAETAKIISPDKLVIVPDLNAGCPMANMVTVRELRAMKQKHPDAVVVTYVNSSAAVKAESDVCCTSANAVQVVASIPADREILFVPDRNLGRWVAHETGREMILWDGYCPTHQRIVPDQVRRVKAQHPQALFVCHPECPWETIELADHVGSTTGILRFCAGSDAREFIIGTEIGLLHRLQQESPGKTFHMLTALADCPNMKLNTLE
ncbi:MAG TPA: quinolinate synthase NadA, partial [Planctomycetota bacterium]|nr:quinolinate synthase NadA [Planctomycetota bacterium]